MAEPTVHAAAPVARVSVEVRCFAASRAALGFSERDVTVHGDGDGDGDGGGVTVGDVVAHLVAAAPSAEPVLARCSVLLDGRRVEASEVVPDGATLDLLPPFAGG
ncbi:MoaD/ThiS family protein [Isoptericola jiangsuensis]|uniref:MoaD/ThiS family protein n=1 Tax=Isoptericola jiangsuensis TaxID=548579 RepID=UPI003AB0D869